MEIRRFGSIISGTYWGCCAICIVQNFNVDPDTPASMQQVYGDTGVGYSPNKFAGKTYREMFQTLIRTGSFSASDMPNHIFLASMTDSQCRSPTGKKWLEILKAAGFEFIRATNNSVGSGRSLNADPTKRTGKGGVYLFGLFRNIGAGALEDPFLPPKEWTDLPSVIPEAVDRLAEEAGGKHIRWIADQQAIAHRKIWDDGVTKFYTEQELIDASVPVMMAGKIGDKPKLKTAPAQVKDQKPVCDTSELLQPLPDTEVDGIPY